MLQFLWTAVSVKNRGLLSVLCVPGRGFSPSAELPLGSVKGNYFTLFQGGPPEDREGSQHREEQGGQPEDRQGCQYKGKAGLSHYISKGVKSKVHQC